MEFDATTLNPRAWEFPPLQAGPGPHLYAQGWPPRPGGSIGALWGHLAAEAGVDPGLLVGSRVGELWPLRALILAISEDVLLIPIARCAGLMGLTPTGAARMAGRARLALWRSPALRAELRPVIERALGVHLPEPGARAEAQLSPCAPS